MQTTTFIAFLFLAGLAASQAATCTMSNCASCPSASNKCGTCNSGFTPSSAQSTCVSCTATTAVVQNVRSNCVALADDCATTASYRSSSAKCKTCSAGWRPSSAGICVDCSKPENVAALKTGCTAFASACDGSSNIPSCATCAAGYQLNSQGACRDCSALNCQTFSTPCDGSTTAPVCGTCKAGYWKNSQGVCMDCSSASTISLLHSGCQTLSTQCDGTNTVPACAVCQTVQSGGVADYRLTSSGGCALCSDASAISGCTTLGNCHAGPGYELPQCATCSSGSRPSIGSSETIALTNPGFETGDLTGWSQSGNLGFTGVTGSIQHSGTFFSFFGPVGSMGYIAQSVHVTAGTTYTLSFWLANYYGAGFVYVELGGSVLLDISDTDHDYTLFELPYVATTTGDVNLIFGFRNDPAFYLLDDVALTGASGQPNGLSCITCDIDHCVSVNAASCDSSSASLPFCDQCAEGYRRSRGTQDGRKCVECTLANCAAGHVSCSSTSSDSPTCSQCAAGHTPSFLSHSCVACNGGNIDLVHKNCVALDGCNQGSRSPCALCASGSYLTGPLASQPGTCIDCASRPGAVIPYCVSIGSCPGDGSSLPTCSQCDADHTPSPSGNSCVPNGPTVESLQVPAAQQGVSVVAVIAVVAVAAVVLSVGVALGRFLATKSAAPAAKPEKLTLQIPLTPLPVSAARSPAV